VASVTISGVAVLLFGYTSETCASASAKSPRKSKTARVPNPLQAALRRQWLATRLLYYHAADVLRIVLSSAVFRAAAYPRLSISMDISFPFPVSHVPYQRYRFSPTYCAARCDIKEQVALGSFCFSLFSPCF
jgi:hypothetical protein